MRRFIRAEDVQDDELLSAIPWRRDADGVQWFVSDDESIHGIEYDEFGVDATADDSVDEILAEVISAWPLLFDDDRMAVLRFIHEATTRGH